ncbi:MAG: transcriptional regulator, GntR family [Solirubrobacterales bacterium]|jgi:GntR family transcriptional regulator|nr:transcriptional regulator, GntR family [Solirubrobacterales bacterium]
MTTQRNQGGVDPSEFAVDRGAEVPIGVQLAWALRTRIHAGRLKPGQRLPALREMADAAGVNVNTVKAVYQRLENEGLIDSQQGSGTFVGPSSPCPPDVAAIVASAVREARDMGVDPREVAAALYVSSEPSQTTNPDAERRRLLRTQIASLERALGEIEAEHPGLAPLPASSPTLGPTLLGAEELEHVRAQLVRRLAMIQAAIDNEDETGAEPPAAKPHPSARRTPRTQTKAKTKRSSAAPRTIPRAALAEQ